jgi:hypothetical protein
MPHRPAAVAEAARVRPRVRRPRQHLGRLDPVRQDHRLAAPLADLRRRRPHAAASSSSSAAPATPRGATSSPPCRTPPVRHRADQVVGNYGAPTVKILGRRVYVLGASDAKAEKVIRGLTVAGAYVDEVTTIPEEFFTQLLGRMSVPGAQLFGTTNPDNPAHWLKAKFLDRLARAARLAPVPVPLDDNPSLRRLRRVDQARVHRPLVPPVHPRRVGRRRGRDLLHVGPRPARHPARRAARTWCGCSPSASTTAPPTPPPRCSSASASTAGCTWSTSGGTTRSRPTSSSPTRSCPRAPRLAARPAPTARPGRAAEPASSGSPSTRPPRR